MCYDNQQPEKEVKIVAVNSEYSPTAAKKSEEHHSSTGECESNLAARVGFQTNDLRIMTPMNYFTAKSSKRHSM